MRETHARQQRLDDNVRADPGYGTAAYFRALDARAPHPHFAARIESVPYIGRLYPIGYYALASYAIAAGDALFHHSVVAQFFAARLLSVLLLLWTLWFSWCALRELPIKRRQARVIFACVVLMPLTAWMAGSVQPDVLVGALVAPATCVALRLRRDPTNVVLLALLGALLAALIATKQHYFLALYLPIAAMLAVRMPLRTAPLRALASAALLTVPAAIAYAVTATVLHPAAGGGGVCQLPSGLSVASRGGPADVLHFFSVGVQRALRGTFLDNEGMSFWLNYTAYHDTPIDIVSRPVTLALGRIIPALSVMLAILFLVRCYGVVKRLALVGCRRSWRAAARVATSNVFVNSYLAFVVIIYGYEFSIGGHIPMQGRYWLPFLPAIWYVTFHVAPRALPRRLRIPIANVSQGLVLLFGVLASAYTFPSLHERFYGPPAAKDPRSELTSAIWSEVAHGFVTINLVVYDLRSAAPVERVVLRMDDRRSYVPLPVDRPDVQCDMEQTLLHVGYTLRLPAPPVGAGRHTVQIFVKTPWSRALIDTGKTTTFTIGTSGSRRPVARS
ncbi:MAG: hypothetical protein NVS3B16_07230 [Vulcanimicrobiaceae bacterium]